MFDQHTIHVPSGMQITLRWHVGWETFDRLCEQMPQAEPLTYFHDGVQIEGLIPRDDESVRFQKFSAVMAGYRVEVYGSGRDGRENCNVDCTEVAA